MEKEQTVFILMNYFCDILQWTGPALAFQALICIYFKLNYNLGGAFLWIIFVIHVLCLSWLSCIVCSLQPCDHLLGKN